MSHLQFPHSPDCRLLLQTQTPVLSRSHILSVLSWRDLLNALSKDLVTKDQVRKEDWCWCSSALSKILLTATTHLENPFRC